MTTTNNIDSYTQLNNLNTKTTFEIIDIKLPQPIKDRFNSINFVKGRTYSLSEITFNGIIIIDLRYKNKIFIGKNLASNIIIKQI